MAVVSAVWTARSLRFVAWSGSALLLLAALAGCTGAGPAAPQTAPDTPPAYDPARLIAVEAPRGSTLRFGIDPQTLSVSADGVVRYVVVASSLQGANTALFEGIRCNTDEFRTYARRNKGEVTWSTAEGSQWVPLYGTAQGAHARAIALAGICTGRAANTPISRMERDLRQAAAGIL